MAALKSFVGIVPAPFQLLLLLLLLLPRELAQPLQLVVRGPPGRITAGSQASFKCSAGGLTTHPEIFMWLKDGKPLGIIPIDIFISQLNLYRVETELTITLEQGDMKSQLTCCIQEGLLTDALQQSFPLRDVLRVPPKVRLETSPPSPVQPNAMVTVTCHTERFYPDDAKVELFAKDAPGRKGTVAQRTWNPDGTFSLETYLEVMATEDRNSSVFLCQVEHNSQPLVNETATLFIRSPFEDHRSLNTDPKSSLGKSILGLCVGLFLNKVAMVLFLRGLFQIKQRGCCLASSSANSRPV
ncbi:tyrosine-protein phosphatase non-receptor type substrate 1-like isoform 1-T2 [Vipera latastei]